MNQKDLRKTPICLLNLALVLQIIYMGSIFWIVTNPTFFLRAAGYEGGYDMPFDSIHFIAGILCTVLFVVMYTILMINIKKQKELGLGMGIFLGAFSYMSYFLMTSLVGKLVTQRIKLLGEDTASIANWTVSYEENVAAYTLIVKWYDYVRLSLKTAIVLLLIAYGVYSYRKREQNMPKRLYK